MWVQSLYTFLGKKKRIFGKCEVETHNESAQKSQRKKRFITTKVLRCGEVFPMEVKVQLHQK